MSERIDAPFHVLLADSSKWISGRGQVPTSVVVHCTDADNPASWTAALLASASPSGSVQAVVDDNQGFTCVPDDAICAGAPPLNTPGLHIELRGRVAWSRARWLDSTPMLHRAAYNIADWCAMYDIETRLLHAADLVLLGEDANGITYHGAVTTAFGVSTLTDPGPSFPWDVLMGLVRSYVAGAKGSLDQAITDPGDLTQYRDMDCGTFS